MFSSVIFSKAFEPNEHNALSLARVFESQSNIKIFICKARSCLNEMEVSAPRLSAVRLLSINRTTIEITAAFSLQF